jgi:hypothetical protein
MVRMLCIELLDRDSKRVIKEECIDKEIFEEYVKNRKDDSTANFVSLVTAIFTNATQGGGLGITLTDINGTSRIFYVKGLWSNPYSIFSTNVTNSYTYITVGTDSTPPSPTDYALKNKVAEKLVESVSADTANRIVTIQATISFTENVTIYEVGLEINAVDQNGTATRLLLDRTVISGGIAVQAGQALRITYRITM